VTVRLEMNVNAVNCGTEEELSPQAAVNNVARDIKISSSTGCFFKVAPNV
jgi:hypothetical protein